MGDMILHYWRGLPLIALGLLAGGPVVAAELNVFRTNKVDRFITNVVEVTMPENRFVTVYRTNYVPVVHTNVANVFVTNFVAVNAYRTNVFEAYRTNFQALNLTNWRTVLVMRTNMTTQFITNTVDLDGSNAGAVIGATVEPEIARGGMVLSHDLTLEAARASAASRNGTVEVVLKLTAKGGQSVQIQQWRVESEDGSVLCFATDQEFKRALAPGRYKVEARAQKGPEASVLITRGTLNVAAREVSIQPKPVAMR